LTTGIFHLERHKPFHLETRERTNRLFTSGRVADAFSAHWMGPPLYVWGCLLFVKTMAEVVTQKTIQLRWMTIINRVGLWTGAAVWLVFWVQRFIQEFSEAV